MHGHFWIIGSGIQGMILALDWCEWIMIHREESVRIVVCGIKKSLLIVVLK